MIDYSTLWSVHILRQDGKWYGQLRSYDGTKSADHFSGEPYSSSSVLFQELLSVLDASMFTSLAIAEGVLPEGQLPLV